MLRSRRLMVQLEKQYYRWAPKFILNSRIFHKLIFGLLIGFWFDVDFQDKYKKFTSEDWISIYDKLFENRIREDDLTNLQKKEIMTNVQGNTVLDIGCGSGSLCHFLSTNNNNLMIKGIDISSKAIAYANYKYRSDKLSFEVHNVTNLSNSLVADTVICTHVLEHIPNIEALVQKLIKLSLRRIIIIVPDEIPNKYIPSYHVHFFNDKNKLSRYFNELSFIEKKIEGNFFYVIDKLRITQRPPVL